MLIDIREERPEDIPTIRSVNVEAFGQPQEANLIEMLRTNDGVRLSLVATTNEEQIVGHILYSPVTAVSGENKITGAGLGPMAVRPTHQRRGIGSKLIEFGTTRLRQGGCPFIVVLGHADYYPRFGFRRASDYGLRCQWNVPDNAFMALALNEAIVRDVSGLVEYRAEFSSVV
jgi:putative acetyltransferase